MGDLITLFPPHGVDQTIHVAILIGVLLLLGLTEAFGWVFSGLVVPGYLASLFVLEPASGATVMVEAVLTFVVAKLLSHAAPRSGAWSLFFGRERFLLLIFISIAVRQASELWLVPDALRLVDEQLGTTHRLTRTFSSVGLVLVPLTANMFWKLDLRRGLVQVAVPTALTFALLAYVLLPYTNLSFARLEITYENVALDFMSSPKAYMLLIAGAYLASRWNLLYGWDYAGILVPALLALAWLSPARLVTTFAETLALVLLVRAIVLVPGFRTMNLEGPRKVALVFTVSFLLKWGLGWVVGPTVSDLRITDLFGFGYLLSSLLAVKILQKDAVARITVPTVVVSVAALVLGSAVGFGLDKLAPAPLPIAAPPPPDAMPATTVLARSPRGVLALGHVRARLDVAGEVPLERSAYELDRYRELWRAIGAWLAAPSEPARADVASRAAALGLALRPIEQLGGRDAWALLELEERLAAQVGWDTAVLIPGAPGPIVAVPRPVTHAPAAEAAAALCERIACRAAIVSGLDVRRVRGFDPDRAPHAIARGAIDRVPALELRADPAAARGRGVLHVANEAPEVNVAALWPRGLELSWQPPPGADPRRGASVLRAHPDDYWEVIVAGAEPVVRRGVSVEAWFGQFFAKDDPRGSPPAAELTLQPPSQSELAFLERVVAAPALERGDPRIAHALGGIAGYAVQLLPDCAGPQAGCWILAEAGRPRRLGWGVLARRTGKAAAPLAIEIPRPRREPGTWRLGVELWRHGGGGTLIVADGEVPDERADADPAATWNTATAFQALHQAVHDVHRAELEPMIVQIRGFGITQPIRDPAVVSLTRPALVPSLIPRRLARLLEAKGPLGALRGARLHDGARELVEVSGIGNPQLHHCARFELVGCAILWFSEPVRDAYRESDRARELAKLARMKLPITVSSAPAALHDPPLAAPDPARIAAMRPRFAELVRLLELYALEQNVQILRRLEAMAAASRAAVEVRGGYSDELGRPFVVAELREGDHALRALALVPSGTARIELDAGGDVADRLPALLAERPRIVTLAGRSRTPAPEARDGR